MNSQRNARRRTTYLNFHGFLLFRDPQNVFIRILWASVVSLQGCQTYVNSNTNVDFGPWNELPEKRKTSHKVCKFIHTLWASMVSLQGWQMYVNSNTNVDLAPWNEPPEKRKTSHNACKFQWFLQFRAPQHVFIHILWAFMLSLRGCQMYVNSNTNVDLGLFFHHQ